MSKLDDLHRRLEAAKNNGIEERAHTALGRLRAEMAETNAYIATLEAENARMREIVAAVARLDRMEVEDGTCPFCGLIDWEYRDAPHTANCPVTKARALLASDTPPRIGEE